jgi:hypothetical protein
MKPILRSVTFRQVIEEHYLAAGLTKEHWLNKLQLESGVSRSSLRAAFNGTRVSPPTALNIAIAVARLHKVDVDQLALMRAPTRPKRAS